jgi:hypothetical protein
MVFNDLAHASWSREFARRVVLMTLSAGASLAWIVSVTHADDSASSKPEDLYKCL